MFAADINRQLICLSGPVRCHGSPRCIYVGYGRYLFVDIVPHGSAISGLHHAPKICTDGRPGKSLKKIYETANKYNTDNSFKVLKVAMAVEAFSS